MLNCNNEDSNFDAAKTINHKLQTVIPLPSSLRF